MVTDLRIRNVGGARWRLTWSSTLSGAVTFYVWRDGRLAGVTQARTFDLAVTPGTAPAVDVLDDGAEVPAAWPGTAVLAWESVSGAAAYRVEQWAGSGYAEVARVVEDGRGYYAWESGWLSDGVVHAFRVTALGGAGIGGTVCAVSALMVRRPDPPSVRYRYDGESGTVEIAALGGAAGSSGPG